MEISTQETVFRTKVDGLPIRLSRCLSHRTVADHRFGHASGVRTPFYRIALVGDTVVHVAVGDLAVGATAHVIQIDSHVTVKNRFHTSAIIVLTAFVASEEDEDDGNEEEYESCQRSNDDADVAFAVVLGVLFSVNAFCALAVDCEKSISYFLIMITSISF